VNLFVIKNNGIGFFNRQDGCIVNEGGIFYLPGSYSKISFTLCLFVKVTKSGKYINVKFCERYYRECSFAINFYAREDNADGLSFFKTTLLDKSLFISNKSYLPCNIKGTEIKINCSGLDNKELNFTVNEDIEEVIAKGIESVSQICTLKTGDMIFYELCDEIEAGRGMRIYSDSSVPDVMID
jgi:hypothetical protein